MKIDILTFLALPDKTAGKAFNRQENFIGYAGDIITPIDSSGYGQWKHIKNPRGWPWDLKLYDENYVYDWITEGPNGWSNDINVGPKSFKKFVGNHFDKDGNPVDGLIMFPRYISSESTAWHKSFAADKTYYVTFENCVATGEASLGTVVQELHGPFMINHGPDCGRCPTLVHKYFWVNNGVHTLEENHYALNYGWVAWILQELNTTTGFYEVRHSTIDAHVYRVPEVKVVFPCF